MNEPDTRENAIARRREEIKLFLGKETEKLRAGGGPGYDLVSEYRKTKKNFSPFVPLAIFAVCAVFLGASFIVTRTINQQSRKVSVDIQAFEDLRLQDLLDQAKNTLNELSAASNELAALEYAMNAELSRVRTAKASSLSLAQALTPSEYKRRSAAIEKEAAAGEQAVRAKYAAQIAEKRVAVKALQERAAAYDARSVEEARKQQEILDNQEKLFEMEKEALRKSYEERLVAAENALQAEKADGVERLNQAISELTARYEKELADLTAKYNPTWTDARGAALASVDPASPRSAEAEMPASAPAGSPVGIEELRSAARRYEDLRYSIGRLRDVPYLNSVPGALAAADAASSGLADDYRRLVGESSSAVRSRDERIARLEATLTRTRARLDSYTYALSLFARDANEAGYVIDGRSPDRVLVYVDPLFRVADGTVAWVFRAVDKPIAEVVLRKDGDVVVARVERMEAGASLQPFDRLLLKLTEKATTGEQK